MKQRKKYLDVLRVVASFAVMIIHISSQYMHEFSPGDYEWVVFRSYLLASNWAVPVFCMISGSLFLARDIQISVIIKKYIFRIAIAFTFWSLLYAVVFESKNGLGSVVASFIRGYSHLWFLYMIAGLYLVTPILRKVVQDETILWYFVLLGFVGTVLIPEIFNITELVSPKASGYLAGAYGNIELQTVSGYGLYFVIGYLLSNVKMPEKKTGSVILLLIMAYVIPAVSNALYSMNTGEELAFLKVNFSVGNMIRSCCIFLIFKEMTISEESKVAVIFGKLAKYSFGAYLIHQMVITLMNHLLGLNTMSFTQVLSVPVIGVITFIVSYLLSFGLGNIPGIKSVV